MTAQLPSRTLRTRGGRRRGTALLLSLLFVAIAAAAVLERAAVSPRLMAAYVERRAMGHNALIEGSGQSVARLLHWLDRGDLVPWLEGPALAGTHGKPPPAPEPQGGGRAVVVASNLDLIDALARALPGDVITLLPGRYRFEGGALEVNRAGSAEAPIVVRAAALGTATLEFALLEGFLITAPYWQFENLDIRGACSSHDGCEHAFHVVGAAEHTVIRNNEVRDFNAHVKVNGDRGRFPDHGRIEGNTLFNTAARRTDAPVTPIDLVAAGGWRIERNLIYDFVKGSGDRTSYGAFAKGGGAGNAFVGNVVLCEHRLRGAIGRRVGLSFGGGGSDPRGCRDLRCVVEHDDGLMQDNLIASCSDEGIYVNRAARTRLIHNTVVDTAGISARFPESNGQALGNLIDGPLRSRDGGSLDDFDNRSTVLALSYLGIHPVRRLFVDADTLNFRWRDETPRRRAGAPAEPDLCGNTRPQQPAYGAFEDFAPCMSTAR
jgi:hypothetical protein